MKSSGQVASRSRRVHMKVDGNGSKDKDVKKDALSGLSP